MSPSGGYLDFFGRGGYGNTMPELGDSVFTSCVHLFTIKSVKGAFARLAKLDTSLTN